MKSTANYSIVDTVILTCDLVLELSTWSRLIFEFSSDFPWFCIGFKFFSILSLTYSFVLAKHFHKKITKKTKTSCHKILWDWTKKTAVLLHPVVLLFIKSKFYTFKDNIYYTMQLDPYLHWQVIYLFYI